MVLKLGTTDLSAQTRSWEYDEEGDDIDVTTYGSDGKEFIQGEVERGGSLEVLDDDASSTVRDKLRVGSSGTLIWYPAGAVTGKPKFTVGTASIRKRSFSHPYDGAVMFTVDLRLSGAITETTV